MIRWLCRFGVLALSTYLLVWAYEGLTGTDQSTSVLPFLGGPDGGYAAVIMIGVAWGLLLMSPGGNFVGTGRAPKRSGPLAKARMSGIAVGTVLEADRTGTTINEVPQYDIYLQVVPADGEEFIGQLRSLLEPEERAALAPGTPFPVRFDPHRPGAIALADADAPEVEEAILQWRVERGLLDPALLPARTRGVSAPASVVEVRPTGVRKENQVQLEMKLLITPEDGRPSWEADTRVFLYPQALSHVQVGSPVYAMYEPHAPKVVAMTIEKPRSTTPGGVR